MGKSVLALDHLDLEEDGVEVLVVVVPQGVQDGGPMVEAQIKDREVYQMLGALTTMRFLLVDHAVVAKLCIMV